MKENKLVELLQKAHAHYYTGNYHGLNVYEAMAKYILAHGKEFVTDNHVGYKWIPVTERMPDHPVRLDWSGVVLFDDDLKEEYKSYPLLVYDGEYHIAEHYMTESVWIEKDGDGCLENVTHWATPEPPKEGK